MSNDSLTVRRSKLPKYRKIIAVLTKEIGENFKHGDLFHSQRELMKRFKVSYATIGHVISDLKKKNLVRCQVGKGIFVENPQDIKSGKISKIMVFLRERIANESSISGMYQKALIQAQMNNPCEFIYHFRKNDDPQYMFESFLSAKADGILFWEDSLPEFVEMIKNKNVPYVMVHPITQKHNFCVDIDDGAGIKDAVSALAAKSCRKILFLSHDLISSHGLLKVEAYRLGLKLNDLPFHQDLIQKFDKDQDLAEKLDAMRNLLKTNKKMKFFDSMLLIHPPILEILESALRCENISVPEDMQIVVFGDFDYALKTTLPIGVIHVPYSEATEKGVEILIERCQHDEVTSKINLCKTTFSWE